ncbi:MAG: hypothetical protein LBS96_05305 [Oscillospiraceae bacterium]|jgi:hypothetical protein|nr:hypothetical protein [Oscillospiraceae bacterium]
METWLKEQLTYGAKYFIPSLLKYPVTPKENERLRTLRAKTGGMIHGLCRADDPGKADLLRAAGVNWGRTGIAFPFDADGGVSEDFRRDLERLRRFRESGVKVLVTTPSVGYFLGRGIDPRTPEGEEKTRTVARFIMQQLQGLASGVCICNEIGIPRFGHPLNMDQAVRFLGVQAEAMAPFKGDIIVGYNTVGPQADQHYKMRPWFPYLDYVGFDMYIGCFFPVLTQLGIFALIAKYLWAFTGMPVMLVEFGYLAAGAPKSKAEKKAVLQKYGANSEKEAKAHIEDFLAHFNETGRKYVEKCATKGKANYVFGPDFVNHLYCELPRLVRIKGCPHTQEGQAEFYRRLLPRLEKLPFLAGMFIYTASDDSRCGICGQAECPTETQWGLCTADGTPKKGYYAVQEIWGSAGNQANS